MQITFLGTSCMVPTKERNNPGIFLSYKNEGILFDCGENTQRQMKIAGLKLTKVTRIIVSHWHGDHVLGIPGLLQTLGGSDYDRTLEIYGPIGTKKHVKAMFEAFVFDRPFEIKVHEVGRGEFVKTKEFSIEAYPLQHRGVETLGFRFIEKDRRRINMSKIKKLGISEGPDIGKLQAGRAIMHKGKRVNPSDVSQTVKGRVIGFIMDTVQCDNCYKIAENADLLISEAAYTSDLENKAEEYKHMTAKQAAQIASQSNVKKLIITHFSARYKDPLPLQEDAQSVFDNVLCAEDMMKVNL